MLIPPFFSPPVFSRRSRRGVALVIVLSVIVLASVLVLSYLTTSRFELASSSTYSRSLVADELARGAVEEIVEGFRTEARQAVLASTDSNKLGLLPLRLGVTELDARKSPVIRRSVNMADGAYTSAFSAAGVTTPPANMASSLSSTTPNADGRKLSEARWRVPQLLEATAAMPLPDWIYMTRQGPKKVTDSDVTTLRGVANTANLDAAVGRYAYVIYDTGGLLDANVAGSPVSDVKVGQKGATALANLLPVFLSFGGNASGVESFLRWRNPTPTRYLGDVYGEDPQPGTAGKAGALDVGFRRIADGNNVFLNRMELLKYATDHSGVFPAGSLRFFSTFSRASNGPEINAAIPGRTGYIAAATNAQIPYYTLEGESKTYAIKASEPFLQRKFPLSRLRWFEKKGVGGSPATAFEAAIKQHFGLTWVASYATAGITAPEFSGKGGYIYSSPIGSTAVASIKTLAQVASENREPDFFEWLKAAIKPESLGISGGNSNTAVTAAQDSSEDFHIIQIGANIIDQADSDDIPTLIASRSATNRNGQALVAFGVESLPYINEVMVSWHRPQSDTTKFNGYLEFEMWNPHQNASRAPRDEAGNNITGNRFRVRVVEGRPWVYPRLRILNSANSVFSTVETAAAARRTIIPKTFTGSPTDDAVTFSYQEADFSEPRLLGDNGSNTTVIDNRIVRFGPPPETAGYKGIFAGGAQAPDPVFAVGTRIPATGVASVVEDPGVPGYSYPIGEKYYNGASFVFVNSSVVNPPSEQPQPLTFVAEVQLSDGSWVAYQTIESWNNAGTSREYPGGKEPRHYGASGNSPVLNWEPSNWQGASNPDWTKWNWSNPGQSGPQGPYSTILTGNVTGRAYRGWEDINYHNSLLKADPRTRRFGVPLAVRRASPGLSVKDSDTSIDKVTDGFPATGLSNWTGASDLFALGQNIASSTLRYTDRDNILRPADWAELGASLPTIPGQTPARPVVLNRPFRSVAELGYAFRDLPWKTLDLFSSQSADLPVLDVFCIEESYAAAGKVNPNSTRTEVLEAILSGASNNSAEFALTSAGVVASGATLASELAAAISGSDAGAVRKASQLAERLTANNTYKAVSNKIHREAYARALAGSTDARTWNLMIDIIAQAGRLPASATKLSQFKMTGERRYWAHVAIDRVTGKVIDMQLEPVYE